MVIEPKVSHAQSKLGAIKPREHWVWTSLHVYVPYKIYICEYCISQLQKTIYCCQCSEYRWHERRAVTNNSLKHVHTQPATQPRCRIAKTRYDTCRAGNKLRHITHARHTPSRHNAIRPVPAANFSNFRHFTTSLASSFSDTRGSLNFYASIVVAKTFLW